MLKELWSMLEQMYPADQQTWIKFQAIFEFPIDRLSLAQLKYSSLKAVQSWFNAEWQSDTLEKFIEQVFIFTRAIHFSIGGAREALNAIQDAITLFESVTTEGKLKEELEEFMSSMMLLVQQAHSEALGIHSRFREVRAGLAKLIYNSKHLREPPIELMGFQPRGLEEAIPEFEKLSENISVYMSWWNRETVRLSSSVTELWSLRGAYNSLRYRVVIMRLRKLKTAFAYYTEEIGRLEDTPTGIFGAFV